MFVKLGKMTSYSIKLSLLIGQSSSYCVSTGVVCISACGDYSDGNGNENTASSFSSTHMLLIISLSAAAVTQLFQYSLLSFFLILQYAAIHQYAS